MLATGTELRAPGEPLAPGRDLRVEHRRCSRAQLARQARTSTVLGSVGDDEDATRDALERGLEADVLVTSGGVSVGPHDLVRASLAALGVEEVFWRVAVKPGKPIAFGVRGRTLVFGLPGNPVSSLVGFELFVRPAVLALQGAARPGAVVPAGPARRAAAPQRRSATSSCARAARRSATASCSSPLAGQESHMIVRSSAATALVLVPRGAGELPAGAPVRYLTL